MNTLVDIQGFKTEDNRFILKEIAILYNNQVQVLIIKPPYPFYDLSKTDRRLVSWIERNRGIRWNQGIIPYSNHERVIKDILDGKTIYVKGLEKITWLKNILRSDTIYNLENKGCPNLIELYNEYRNSGQVYSCIFHNSICALKNVTSIRKWCCDNKILF